MDVSHDNCPKSRDEDMYTCVLLIICITNIFGYSYEKNLKLQNAL